VRSHFDHEIQSMVLIQWIVILCLAHNQGFLGRVLVSPSPSSVSVLFCRHLVAALSLHAFCGLVENEIS
jgi:hypothetical protein